MRLENEVLRLQEVEADYQDLQRKYAALQKDFQAEHKNLKSLSSKYSNLMNTFNALQGDYDALLEKNKALVKISSEEKADLTAEILNKQEALREKEERLQELSLELKAERNNLGTLQDSLEIREARITKLEKQLQAQRSKLLGVKNQISDALLGFPKEDLTVEQKNGKIYVSLSQNLLFAKGSDRIDPKGIQAIQKLAEVLKKHQKLNIEVEGHTDSDGSISRNWELSTERALSVVKVLQDSGVDPTRITASGRAFYAPVAPNDSPEHKALNRRTEIILSPDLHELLKLVDGK